MSFTEISSLFGYEIRAAYTGYDHSASNVICLNFEHPLKILSSIEVIEEGIIISAKLKQFILNLLFVNLKSCLQYHLDKNNNYRD